jgi:nucleoside-diphosphate-sugar epimerase
MKTPPSCSHDNGQPINHQPSTIPPPSCIVLGGKGFVGSAIATEARTRGYDVLVVDKDEYDKAVGTFCDLLINANGNSKKFLARENPALEFDLSTRSVLRSIHDFPTRRYVFLSTMDVYPDISDPVLNDEGTFIDIARQSPYGFHKYLAEQVVRHYARNWLIFRMAGFVGKGLWKNSIFDLLSSQPIRVHPDSEYQYLNTHDLARIVLTVAEHEVAGEIYNVTGDGRVSLRQVAGIIPGCRLEPACETLPRERYDLNISKISRLYPVPRSEDTILAFVNEQIMEHHA